MSRSLRRELTPSLAKIRCRWPCTVRGDTISRSPISRFRQSLSGQRGHVDLGSSEALPALRRALAPASAAGHERDGLLE